MVIIAAGVPVEVFAGLIRAIAAPDRFVKARVEELTEIFSVVTET